MPMFRERPRAPVRAEQWFPNKPVDGVTYPLPDDVRYLYAEVTDCGVIMPPLSQWPTLVPSGAWIVFNGDDFVDWHCDELFREIYEEVKS